MSVKVYDDKLKVIEGVAVGCPTCKSLVENIWDDECRCTKCDWKGKYIQAVVIDIRNNNPSKG